jgi:NADP-dependent 3-hydroxy acid dehydrogenase YdfG
MTTLTGKVAVITGASRWIGASLAHLLDEQSVKLGLASRRGDDLGLDAVSQPCDVRDYAQVESLINATVVFALTRPRNHRLLDVVFRPMAEPSWG